MFGCIINKSPQCRSRRSCSNCAVRIECALLLSSSEGQHWSVHKTSQVYLFLQTYNLDLYQKIKPDSLVKVVFSCYWKWNIQISVDSDKKQFQCFWACNASKLYTAWKSFWKWKQLSSTSLTHILFWAEQPAIQSRGFVLVFSTWTWQKSCCLKNEWWWWFSCISGHGRLFLNCCSSSGWYD